MGGKSPKGFFYLGISLYKQKYFKESLKAFQKSSELKADDAQLQYNLGLAYFQLARYDAAVEHFKLCKDFEPKHFYAYNNLCFIFNMHQMYPETLNTANLITTNFPNVNHMCYRHWAFALYKKSLMGKAVEKIKQAVLYDPKDPENWLVWGLIMRTVGNYPSAKHKFERALKLDPNNEAAALELEILLIMMSMDEKIPQDHVPAIAQYRAYLAKQPAPTYRKQSLC